MRRALVALLIVMVAAVVWLLAAGPGGGQVVRSDKPYAASPQVTDADLKSVVDGDTAFAFDLYQALREQEGNLFFSPHSISVALAMTYAGARGETERQMADTLHFALPQQRLHPAFNALGLGLAERAGEGLELHVANAIWGQTGEPFLPAFLDRLATDYDAGMRLVDFMREPDRSRETINKWASDETKGKIENLLPPELVDRDTVLILTNAIYFDGKWETRFQRDRAEPGEFTMLDGNRITTDMMSQEADLPYADVGDCLAVELPYQGGKLSMVVLLPEGGGFGEFERSLDAERVQATVDRLRLASLDLTMPKFSCESAFGLRHTLSAMGMPVAFDGGADFSGINGRGGLSITDVVHKAMVQVDEEGTIAAAATAVVVERGGPATPTRVIVDRPFIFLIRDSATGAILFMGRVLDPRA
jgi:serpin B